MDLSTRMAREHARTASGRFGEQLNTAPEMTLEEYITRPPTLFAAATVPVPRVKLTWHGWKTVTDDVEVTGIVRIVEPEHVIDGDRGERIVDGQAYLPWSRVEDDPSIETAIHHFAATARDEGSKALNAESVRRHVRDNCDRLRLIDGQLHARASYVRVHELPTAHNES